MMYCHIINSILDLSTSKTRYPSCSASGQKPCFSVFTAATKDPRIGENFCNFLIICRWINELQAFSDIDNRTIHVSSRNDLPVTIKETIYIKFRKQPGRYWFSVHMISRDMRREETWIYGDDQSSPFDSLLLREEGAFFLNKCIIILLSSALIVLRQSKGVSCRKLLDSIFAPEVIRSLTQFLLPFVHAI